MREQAFEEKIIIYGAGRNGHCWAKKLGSERIEAFVDRDPRKIGQCIEDIPVKDISQLNSNEKQKIFISVSKQYHDEIMKTLKECGLDENVIDSPYLESTVKIAQDASFDADTSFEGANYIGKGSSVAGCIFGFASYLADNVKLSNVKCGRYTSIAEGVSLIKGRHPSKGRYVSTHPAFFSVDNGSAQICFTEKQKFDEFIYTDEGYSCEIGNDVWIGKNVQIKEGVKIGDGAIIGAGAVVVKDVSPYEIVGGVPAKTIRYRFAKEDIDFLMDLKWWNKDLGWIKEKSKFFDDLDLLRKNL